MDCLCKEKGKKTKENMLCKCMCCALLDTARFSTILLVQYMYWVVTNVMKMGQLVLLFPIKCIYMMKII